ncbi:hypothetical protein AVEN_162173-1 [Araneus ventricosus]|uniref:Uncharacterized protein n=1 Tax=Araneus ventricosus TaxID=182803 RepID=A0A4Y2H0Z5_ARAVE|nr:hypothetical protein AVEN_162173-1 [Araneus ventricosus]
MLTFQPSEEWGFVNGKVPTSFDPSLRNHAKGKMESSVREVIGLRDPRSTGGSTHASLPDLKGSFQGIGENLAKEGDLSTRIFFDISIKGRDLDLSIDPMTPLSAYKSDRARLQKAENSSVCFDFDERKLVDCDRLWSGKVFDNFLSFIRCKS